MCTFDAYYLYTVGKLLVKTASTAALNHRNIVWWVVLVIDPLFTFDYAAILWSSLIYNKHISPSPPPHSQCRLQNFYQHFVTHLSVALSQETSTSAFCRLEPCVTTSRAVACSLLSHLCDRRCSCTPCWLCSDGSGSIYRHLIGK